MNITFCVYDAPHIIDGPTSWIKRLFPFLRKNGIETRILFITHNVKPLTTLDHFESEGYKCKLIPAHLFLEEQVKMITEDLAEFPPEVFIPNYFPAAGYAARFARQAGIPTIMVLHNDDENHRNLAKEFAGKDSNESLSALIAVSKMLEKEILAFNFPHTLVDCIPCGAPVPTQQTHWDPTTPLKLIYFGRLNNNQKRISDLTQAFCRVTKELENVEATIYGNGIALEEVLAILNNTPDHKVKYGGIKSIEEMQDTLLENHVVVLLSNYEGIPVSLMEAMGCGLVPVCSDIKSGIAELIVDGENGLIVTDRDQAFVNAIKRILSDPAQWNILSNNARQTIIEEYADDLCYGKWKDLLIRLAKENPTPRKVRVPSIAELKSIAVPTHFLQTESRMPSTLALPFLRVKRSLGLWKRQFEAARQNN